MTRREIHLLFLLPLFVIVLIFSSCSTGVEPSPQPGILRVFVQADPSDTTIKIVGDEYVPDSTSSFIVKIFQGRVFNQDNYAILFPNLKSYLEKDIQINLLEREGSEYKIFKIFESYVPPAVYTKIQFGLNAGVLKIGDFKIPITIDPESKGIVVLEKDFEVKESQTTELLIHIKPFQSLQRIRDAYFFNVIANIIEVNIEQH